MARKRQERKGVRALIGSIGLFLALIALVAICVPAGFAADEARYIVVLENSVDDPDAVGRAQTEQHGGRLGFVYGYGPIGYSATLPSSAVEALWRDPRVRDIRVDQLSVAAAQTTPTGVKRVFASTNKALMIDEKSNFTVNADVAVIDSGIDIGHPDLSVVKRTYCNGTKESATCTDNTGSDETGHGTAVAGPIAALDNGVGVVGVAPGARLWAVKVLDPDAWESEVTAGINWVTKHANEIEVANLSHGCDPPCSFPTAIEAISKSVAAGVVYVGAAGNESVDAKEGGNVGSPESILVSAIADYDGASGEAATALWSPSCKASEEEGDEKQGADDTLATFSNFGKVVDMAAPGVCILTTMAGGGYGYEWGTSVAAPHVAGAAAIRAALSNPNSKADVEAIRATLLGAGNTNWKDTSGDGAQEKLLDVSSEVLFKK